VDGGEQRTRAAKMTSAIEELHLNRNLAVLCRLLRENDPETTEIDLLSTSFPRGYLQRLVAALQENTTVTRLLVETCAPIHNQTTDEEIQLLLTYLKTSESLREVELHEGFADEYLGQFLNAVADNGRITSLVLGIVGGSVPIDALSRLLRMNTSLTTLEVFLPGFEHLAHADLVGHAFGQAQSLDHFTLHLCHSDEINLSVFRRLHLLPHLRYASFETLGPFGEEISKELEAYLATTTTLQHFKFDPDGYDFPVSKHDLIPLVAGLSVNTSVTELTFDFCTLDKGARRVFAQLFQLANIKTINLGGIKFHGRDDTGRVIGQMLKGSPLKVLCMRYVSSADFDGFCNALRTHAPSCRLETLHVNGVGDNGGTSFFSCLPKLVHIKNVHIMGRTSFATADFLHAVWQNGSLHRIDVGCRLDRVESIRLDAYLQRNKNLTKMLAPIKRNDGSNSRKDADTSTGMLASPALAVISSSPRPDDAQDATAIPASDDLLEESAAEATEMSLVPALMAVAEHTPQMCPHNVYAGLLAGSLDLGRGSDRKRSN
jgi:hypothetical protein